MYKRILIAVDGSPTSDLALREAAKLAKEQGSQLLVVCVADNVSLAFTVPYDLGAVRQAVMEATTKILEHAAAQLKELGAQAETRLIDLNGENAKSVAGAVVLEANAWSADLIILGTHGRRGIRRAFLGSVAENIVRLACQPVLLVRGPVSSLRSGLNPGEVYSDWPEDEVIGG